PLGREQAAGDLRLQRVEVAGDGGEHARRMIQAWPRATLVHGPGHGRARCRPAPAAAVPCVRGPAPGGAATPGPAATDRPEEPPMSKPRHALPASLVALALALAGCGGGGEDAAPAPAPVDVAAPSRAEAWSLPSTLPGSASPSL